MSKQLARTVLQAFNLQPALLSPSHSDVLMDAVRDLVNVKFDEEQAEAKHLSRNMIAAYGGHYEVLAEGKPFAYADGVAYIPVSGILVNRLSCSWGWITGYNFIREQLNAALADSDVKLIVFDVNSGGGQAAGCFELANEIYASRKVKPSVAVIDSACLSAAYAIASAATKLVCTPSGSSGSIGVILTHIDMSKALESEGVKVTLMYSGSHKADGNKFQPLPEPVKADIQKQLDVSRQEFVNLVARNKGIDSKVIYDTEAQTYSASDALSLGLIDAIAPPIEAVQAFFNELSGSDTTDKEVSMSKEAAKPGAESTAAAPEQPQVQTAASAPTQVESAAPSADVAVVERQRIQAITTCAEASDKSALASHIAFNTNMSVDDAKKMLAAAAPEKAASAPAASAFTAAMDAGKHPNVGAGAGDASAQANADDNPAKRILAAQALATGIKY